MDVCPNAIARPGRHRAWPRISKVPFLSRLGMASDICFQRLAAFSNRAVSIRIWGRRCRFIDTFGDNTPGQIDPTTMGLQATVGADGAKDRRSRNWCTFTLFNN